MRPEKNKVEYFTHDCRPGRTIKILKSFYGNDGYAFWFQLLQILGETEGHAYYASDKLNWLHLISETAVNEETANKILSTLVDLHAIDKDLWETSRIIWCQNFVDRLEKLYERRKGTKPQPPKPKEAVIVNINPVNVDINPVNVNRNTQRRVEERREEKSRVKRTMAQKSAPAPIPESVAIYRDIFLRYPNKIQWEEIIEVATNIELWKSVCKAWALNTSWNPLSIGKMLDAYRAGGVRGNSPPGKGKLDFSGIDAAIEKINNAQKEKGNLNDGKLEHDSRVVEKV